MYGENAVNQIRQASGHPGVTIGHAWSQPESPATPMSSEGRVLRGLAASEKLTEAVHQEISILEARLAHVLRPVPPDGQGAGGEVRPAMPPSQLASGIEQLNERLHQICGYVRSLTSRVDL